MATVKKGMLTATGEWWRHLRWNKRVFWKSERQAAKKFAQQEAADTHTGRCEKAGKTQD